MTRYLPDELLDVTDDLRVQERAKSVVDGFRDRFMQPPEPPPLELPKIDIGSALQPFRDEVQGQIERAGSGIGQSISGVLEPFRQQVAGGMPSNGVQPVMRGPQDIEGYIRQAAAKRGIDPEIAVKVAMSEGGVSDPVRQSDFVQNGKREESFGPFQLYLGGGLGNAALKQGIDPRNPEQWRQGVDFALDEAAKSGWGPWYGAARVGIGNRQGLEAARPVGISQATALPAPGQTTSAAFDANSIAKQWEGTPYVFGGAVGRSKSGVGATDCSGFTAEVSKQLGAPTPAHTDAAYNYLKQNGQTIDPKDAKPWDYVFYLGAGSGGAITNHMGFFAGPGKVLDMSVAGGGGVKERALGHAGEYVIMRDPRLNPPVAAQREEVAPPIIETGVAEKLGGQKIKGMSLDAALAMSGTRAMEDLSDGLERGSSSVYQIPPVNGVDGPGGIQPPSGPPPRDIRSDYAPRAVEPGDYEIASTGAPSTYGLGANLETASLPLTRPDDAVEPPLPGAPPPEAPASSGNPIVDLFSEMGQKLSSILTPQKPDYGQVGQDIQTRQATVPELTQFAPTEPSAPSKPDFGMAARDIQERSQTFDDPGGPMPLDAAGETFARGREAPSLSQQAANTAGRMASDVVESNREGWQRFGSKYTGGLIPDLTDEEKQAAMARSIKIIEENPFAPGVYTAVPEVIGMASTSREALERIGRERAPGRVPSPSMGIVSRAQADDAVPAVDRYYHGTGSDFARPSGELWLTDNPSTASDFAVARSSGFKNAGPNVRAVDVPRDLNFVDSSNPEHFQVIEDALAVGRKQSDPALGNDAVNDYLHARGFDGIKEVRSDSTRIMIFPESLDKITNATARTPGGLLPSGARDTAGQPSGVGAAVTRSVATGAGSAYQESQQEGATPESILRAGVGGAATSLGNAAVGKLAGRRAVSTLARAVNDRVPTLEQQGDALPPRSRPITLDRAAEIERLKVGRLVANVPDDIKDAVTDDIIRAAEDVNWARTQRRGVLPDDVVAEMAEDMARRGDAWLGDGRAGRAYNPEETVALRNLVTGQAVRVRELTEEIAAARTAGSTPDILVAKRAAEASKLEGFIKLAEGAKAETGRTLRQYANAVRLIDADPDQAIQHLYRRLGGRDNATKAVDEYTKLIQDGADPFQMAKFWSKVEKPPPGAADWFATLRYNSMLSGPRTFEINTIGSATEIPWRIARDFGASTLRGRPEELAPELTGLWVGAQKGAQAFMETLAHGITLEQAARGDLPRDLASRIDNPVAKGVATTLETPGRIMQATDEMFRQMAFAMGKYRLAAVTASKEGLRGQAWSQRIAQLVEDSPKAMILEAEGIADRMTYHNDMGRLGRALGEVQKVPYIGNIAMPFLRTVYNIAARGIDRSPVGAFGTAIDVARGVYNPGKELPKGVMPIGERIGDNIMGSGIIAGVYLLGEALKGVVSGAGPDDTEKREQLRAQGWQPYSVKIGDKWVSYSNWGPVSIGLAQAAATAEANLYRKPDDTDAERTVDALRRFGELTTEQTYLQGIGALYKAIKEPDVYGTAWLTQFMQTLVPFGSAINTVGQATDPIQRRPDRGDIGQAMAGRFPDAPGNAPFVEGRTSVPPQQDVLGRSVPSTTGGASAFNPFRVSQERPDPVLAAFQQVGVDIGRPPKQLTFQNTNIELTPQEQRRYQQIMGETLQQRVGSIVTSEGWSNRSSASRQQYLKSQYESARERAEVRLRIENREAFMQRRREAVPAR